MATLSSHTLSDSPPYSISKEEAMFYYAGISPTPPKLVYRTGSAVRPFTMPKGFEAYRRLKQARGVFGHLLNDVWELAGPKVRDLLTASKMAWTSIDSVRFVTDGDETVGPVVVWIGVRPDSLGVRDASDAACAILAMLGSFNVHDVEVEFRESVYRHLIGPPLLKPVMDFDKSVNVRSPLTPSLGLYIAATDRPTAQGTMALFLAEGGQSKKLLGLTCHHVVLKVDATTNEDFNFQGAGAPRKHIQLLGSGAFGKLVESIQAQIDIQNAMVEFYERQVRRLESWPEADNQKGIAKVDKALKEAYTHLADTHEAIEDLQKFLTHVKKDWGLAEQRVIGFIRHSPPVSFNVSPGGFSEDWAVLELDNSKFTEFRGNAINICSDMTRETFTSKMYLRDDCKTSFKYPLDHLLPLHGMISEEQMLKPETLDSNGDPCLLVIKNGTSTGVTIGRATGIQSFVRDENTGEVSREWAIYNYDNKSGVFSAPGDSGSIVVDGLGHIGGMLHGGAGKTDTCDVTYVTPMWWLWPRIKAQFPDANLYPTGIIS